ncbi:sensor domain-containing diguanylate cyclase [Lutispora thermophila]|uniref:PAS domain S-box-containing protein/diguanylate cyclase (GGDEF) domain-containing protein n=1 Tax=Lutispora thermophila DSM 19022 TaxID=1122184 RepID=A0A1M6DA01_9FIRM|nr:sensor domain-containing diguanylate cyclase [Lutispora thermophila]SHI69858.1 PAS domain S-box-containing protein/diguanylate cyclase (GGDEF) domain-containing protein [Lutispora thermophila DSM 19022]
MNLEKSCIDSISIYTEKLRQAYEIIEKTSIVIFEWSIGPGIPVKYVSENISNYGYTSDEFYSGKIDYWDFVHKDDVEKTMNAIYEKRASKEKEFKHTYRVVCKDGSIRWVEEWTLWERDSYGNPIAEKGIIRDITEQKETAEKLRQSEERYRKLFENACALICTFDGKGRFTSINNACADITGYSKSELMNMSIFDFLVLSKADEKVLRRRLIGLISKIQNKNIELTIMNKNKMKIILEGRLLLINENYSTAEIQAVLQDVTSKKEAENKIYHLSYHDKLTDLYNRAYFDETLEKMSQSGEFPYSLIMGDMNGLKSTNDLYGHKTGDKLIQTMADILRKCCRKSDIIARIGGDEFAIILPNCSDQEARKICNRIKRMCALYENDKIKPDISLGYSTKENSAKTNDDLILEADRKMYLDKACIIRI